MAMVRIALRFNSASPIRINLPAGPPPAVQCIVIPFDGRTDADANESLSMVVNGGHTYVRKNRLKELASAGALTLIRRGLRNQTGGNKRRVRGAPVSIVSGSTTRRTARERD